MNPLNTQKNSNGLTVSGRGRALLASLKNETGQEITTRSSARSSARVVYLVIDCSASMNTENKLQNAARGASEFARQAFAKGYMVGLIKFDSSANTVLSATIDSRTLTTQLGLLTIGGSTDMAGGIERGIQELKEAIGERVLYIVTDGQPDDRNAALAAAQLAKDQGIGIMTLGTDDADSSFLAKLATRAELAVKVERAQLQNSVSNMAKFLLSDNTKGK